MPNESRFYHSFPRFREGRDQNALGLNMLECIIDHGLVLAPETRSITLPDNIAGAIPGPLKIAQKRVCFTLLNPDEISDHSKKFGPISIEWQPESLRKLGALPAMYFSLNSEPNSIEPISIALLTRLSEIDLILSRLSELSILTDSDVNDQDDLIVPSGNSANSRVNIGGIRQVLRILGENIYPFHDYKGALQGLSGYFCPLEDLDHTDALGYYRQREWRIIGNMQAHGVAITPECSVELKEKLTLMDQEFWDKELEFQNGNYPRKDRSQVYEYSYGRPIIESASAIIGPQNLLEQIREIVDNRGLKVPVKAMKKDFSCNISRFFNSS